MKKTAAQVLKYCSSPQKKSASGEDLDQKVDENNYLDIRIRSPKA